MRSLVVSMMMVGALGAGPATADDNTPDPAKARPVVPLRVQLVMTRLQAEKKIASYPYVFTVTTTHAGQIRMGTEVPIAVSMKDGSVSFQYRNVGANLECNAEALDNGRFRLSINMENSSLGDLRNVGKEVDVPMFVTRNTRSDVILRDGETQTYSSATDPASGEVVKVDVTLTVLK